MSRFGNTMTKFYEAREGKGFSYLFTIVIGLGFFTTAITWSMYNVYIPVYLESYLRNIWGDLRLETTIIAIIMVLDNIAAVLIQPYIGNRSDHTWTKYGPNKYGRRMPYVVVGIPLGAMFFVLLAFFGPVVFAGEYLLGFILLLLVIGGFNISMALYRSPVVSLMPDIVPKMYRSRGNGIINLLGGVGGLLGLFGTPALYRINPIFAFVFVGIILILTLFILYISIKEPKEVEKIEVIDEKDEKLRIIPAIKLFFFETKDKSMVFILFAVLAWFIGYNIIETFFSLYAVNVLEIEAWEASYVLGVFMLTFIIFALPAGILAKKIGRKQTILGGLSILIIVLAVVAVLALINIPALMERIIIPGLGMNVPYMAIINMICFFFGGIGWAMVNINSIVIVWELAGKNIGTGTGLYYFFSSMAAIAGPVGVALILDAAKLSEGVNIGEQYKFMFSIAVLFFILAFILVLFIKTTGKELDDEIEEILPPIDE